MYSYSRCNQTSCCSYINNIDNTFTFKRCECQTFMDTLYDILINSYMVHILLINYVTSDSSNINICSMKHEHFEKRLHNHYCNTKFVQPSLHFRIPQWPHLVGHVFISYECDHYSTVCAQYI